MDQPLQKGYTRPPLRFRLVSADFLCPRSMEVEWEDDSGKRHEWSSWQDDMESGCFEASKLLPASARGICISFKVHGPGGPWDVHAVDRRRGCAWLKAADGTCSPEVLWLRLREEECEYGLDALFELKGPMHACYLAKAANAAPGASRQWWEHWPEQSTRPQPEEHPATLLAADSAAPLVGFGEPPIYYKSTSKRMCAAARALMDVHRETIAGLRDLDRHFTGQWLGVNSANSAAAGMGIAAAVLLFVVPPVGVGLGAGSAATGCAAWAGDCATDYALFARLRKQLAKDAWNSFSVAELMQQWMQAQEAYGAWTSSTDMAKADTTSTRRSQQTASAQVEKMVGRPVDRTIMAGAVSQGTASTATKLAARVANLGSGAAIASQVFGVVGALVSTGVAVRGWSCTKSGQKVVRDRIGGLSLRIVQIQHLLAAVDRLECPYCADDITLMDDVRRCGPLLHCYHASCAARLQRCSCCSGPLEDTVEQLVDSVANFEKRLVPAPGAKELLARGILRMHRGILQMQREAMRSVMLAARGQMRLALADQQVRPRLVDSSART